LQNHVVTTEFLDLLDSISSLTAPEVPDFRDWQTVFVSGCVRMEAAPKSPKTNSDHPASRQTLPAVEPEDVLDWDFRLEVNATHRGSGVIEAVGQSLGRATPFPLTLPDQ